MDGKATAERQSSKKSDEEYRIEDPSHQLERLKRAAEKSEENTSFIAMKRIGPRNYKC